MASKINKLLKQAERHFAKGDLAFARKCYEQIIDEDSQHTEAMNNLGVVFFQEGRIDEAIDQFQKVLAIHAKDPDAFANLEMVETYLKAKIGINPPSQRRLNVGFITIWFERGQSYVTKMIRDAVAGKHESFVFARTGGVYGKAMVETTGQWAVPNLTVWPHYDIPGDVIDLWIKDNHLDVVVFNEEYDWKLVKAVKQTGVKLLTYLDYYKDDWCVNMGLYDAVLCSTKRTYHLVKDVCRAHYIKWGVDTDLFRPPVKEPEYTFFHNAGWLGINYRKMTPATIAAFDAISKVKPDLSLFVHSQVGLDMLPPVVVDIVKHNPRITYHLETLPAPGLYHKGKIMVFPTKLEGLGLTLFEGLSCGLPMITTNGPPMNEFVKDHHNGLLVDLAFRATRDDNVAFPEEIVDMTDLAVKMGRMADDAKLLKIMSQNARRYAEEELAFPLLAERILRIFAEVC
jgi:glycosyltransferase involved in cell wall biosynthesis